MIGTVYEMFNSVIINIIIFLRRSTMDFEAIKKAAAAYGPDMTRFLRDMIAIPSESCEEKGVVMRIKDEM